MESFLGFYFLFYFSFKNKNKISGDSNFFFKNQFFTNKKRVSPIEWGRTWKMRVHTRYIRSFLLVSHYSPIFHIIMLFGVDNEGHQSACWSMTLHLCLPLSILTGSDPIVIMKCLRIMRVVAFWYGLLTYSEDSWMIHEVDFLRFSFIYLPSFALFFLYFPCFLTSVMVRVHFLIPARKRS